MYSFKYRVEFMMGDTSSQYFYSDDINVIARNLMSFAILNQYLMRLDYILAYACFQTLDNNGKYDCSCSSIDELQQAFNEAVSHIVSSQE